ncbi:MAG: GspE/PulE family protein [Patescibacteria group bacterium]
MDKPPPEIKPTELAVNDSVICEVPCKSSILMLIMALDGRAIDEQNTAKRAGLLGIAYFDTSGTPEKILYKQYMSVPEMYAQRIVPTAANEGTVTFGITTTTTQTTMTNVAQRFGDQRVSFVLISDSGYRDYMALYDPPKTVEYKDISLVSTASHSVADISATLAQVRADDMLAYLVQQAFKLGASDIHLETAVKGARVRFRVHGVLHPVATLESDKYRQLMSVLASAANVSTSATDDQTGHVNRAYKLATGEDVVVNLRVETVPAVNGIDAVLRLFNFQQDRLRLDKLGLDKWQEDEINDIVHHPNGLVLIVGPTGSGKTTTLYSILNELNNPERKIITLEDPVEFQIEGITQIPVKSREGANFADKFRSVMRLDPDVVMVGEIRDNDTAKTALQAALTGHLVLSTYHAGSAAAAMTRLIDAIGENPLYISAIRLVQAQRLVRQLDDATKQAYEPDEHLKSLLAKIIEGFPEGAPRPDVNKLQLYHAGTSPENPFGFNDQFAIRELLMMTPAMQQVLMRPAREISTSEIEKVAVSQGMLTMLQDGVLKAVAGKTTIEEIFRVVG